MDKLIHLYSLTPETGLYSINNDKITQVKIFLRYVQFLKKCLYNSPRLIELRKLTQIMQNIQITNPTESQWLFEYLNVSYNDKQIRFDDLLKSYDTKSSVNNAGKLYTKYLKSKQIIEKCPYDSNKIKKIRIGLTKKYSESEVSSRLATILESTKIQRDEFKKENTRLFNMLQQDSTYISWNKMNNLWFNLGFSDLASSFHKLDTDNGAIRSTHGNSLEFASIDTVLQFFSENYNISQNDLHIVKNVVIKASPKETIGEIDMIVINNLTNTIIGFVEVKSGIYDIPYAIEQLEKIVQCLKTNPNIIKIKLDELIRMVVVTSIPPHNPITGASYSDVQLISSALFSKTDVRLKNIINAIENNIDLNANQIDNVYEILSNLRQNMMTHIDPLTAINSLGKNLLTVHS